MSIYSFKYRPDEQYYELGKGIDIVNPWIGTKQFLKVRDSDFTGSAITQVNIAVANSESDLYTIFDISTDLNLDFKIFKIGDNTFSSKSIRSKNNTLRIIIYAKKIYSKASLKDDDDSNLTDGAKLKLSNKDYINFVREYGNYYVSAIEKVQVSAIALDFVNVERDDIEKFKNDFALNASYSDVLTFNTKNNLESLIEKKLSSSELNIQLYDFNKYNFQKDDQSAKTLLGGNASTLLTSIGLLLEKKIVETFSFENAASSVFHLSPMSNFDVPQDLIPPILDTRLDEEGELMSKLFGFFDVLTDIGQSEYFTLFPDKTLKIELKRLGDVIKTLQESFTSQAKSYVSDVKNGLLRDSLLKDNIKFPSYKDDGFLVLETSASFNNSLDFLAYKEYIEKVTSFFIDKYSQSPLTPLNVEKVYDTTAFFPLKINDPIMISFSQMEQVVFDCILSTKIKVLEFVNAMDKFDVPDRDHPVSLELHIRFLEPMITIPLYSKFLLDIITTNTTHENTHEIICTGGLITSSEDNKFGAPPLPPPSLEDRLSKVDSRNENLTLRHFFNIDQDRKPTGFRLMYLGHFDPYDTRVEPETSPIPVFLQKFSARMNLL